MFFALYVNRLNMERDSDFSKFILNLSFGK